MRDFLRRDRKAGEDTENGVEGRAVVIWVSRPTRSRLVPTHPGLDRSPLSSVRTDLSNYGAPSQDRVFLLTLDREHGSF